MSLSRCVLLVCLISFSAAAGLFFFGSKLGYEEFRGGYAVLSVDAYEDEANLLSLLQQERSIFTGDIISESSQRVYLDEFDKVITIPLNQYEARIFPFDPRNDGYAGKLKEIFINDDKRLLYVPLPAGNWNTSVLDKQFSDLLGDISFSAEYSGVGRPLLFFFASYAAASFLLFIICLFYRKQQGGIACILALIPVMASLAFFGSHGIACAAVLTAVFVILKDLIFEYIALSGVKLKKRQFKLKSIYNELIIPFRFYWFLLFITPAVFFVIIYFSQINIIFPLAVSAVSLIVFLLSIKIMSISKVKHKRFTPVMIIRRKTPETALPFFVLPFSLAAVFILFMSSNMTAFYESNKNFDNIITEKDYYDHIEYQEFFSYRRIDNSSSAFPDFHYGDDNLPSMSAAVIRNINQNDYPSFPLKQLMDFFNDVNSKNKTDISGDSSALSVKLSFLVLLLYLIPVFFPKRKNNQMPKIRTIRASGILRSKGINWNKKTLYNGRNNTSIQKDA